MPRLHPGCSTWLPMGPVTDDLRPLPHLSLLLLPMGTSDHTVGESLKNKTKKKQTSKHKVTVILSIPLRHQSEWSHRAACSKLSVKGKHPSFLPRAKNKRGPTVLPHISDGLDLSTDSCALPSSLPFFYGSLFTMFFPLPGLDCTHPTLEAVEGTLSACLHSSCVSLSPWIHQGSKMLRNSRWCPGD